MFLKKLVVVLAVSFSFCNVVQANNNIRIFVSKETQGCVSFNLVKIQESPRIDQRVICSGDYSFFDLDDGAYKLYATTKYLLPNQYGDQEYIFNPISLENDSSQAIYYPSRFRNI